MIAAYDHAIIDVLPDVLCWFADQSNLEEVAMATLNLKQMIFQLFSAKFKQSKTSKLVIHL